MWIFSTVQEMGKNRHNHQTKSSPNSNVIHCVSDRCALAPTSPCFGRLLNWDLGLFICCCHPESHSALYYHHFFAVHIQKSGQKLVATWLTKAMQGHCRRDWWNSGAKQELSQFKANIFPPISWRSWENGLFQHNRRIYPAKSGEKSCLAPDVHQSRLQWSSGLSKKKSF